ncbi:hypothetical protein QQ045_032148 [Rhodiola kirilowii]
MCTEWLARSLEEQQSQRLIRGVKMSRHAPMITNLMFADDSIIFVSEVDDILRLKTTLVRYEELSGQQVNFNKSKVCVANNVDSGRARLIKSLLGMNVIRRIEKYLSLPIYFSRRRVELLSFVESRIWKKVNGWKETCLSAAGKEILIKSVSQSIPIYVMSCFKLPVSISKRLTSYVAKYWWNDVKEKRYILGLSTGTLEVTTTRVCMVLGLLKMLTKRNEELSASLDEQQEQIARLKEHGNPWSEKAMRLEEEQ